MSPAPTDLSLTGINIPVSSSRPSLFFHSHPATAGVHLRWSVDPSLGFPRDLSSWRHFTVERFSTQDNIPKIISREKSAEAVFGKLEEIVNNRYSVIATIPVSENSSIILNRLNQFERFGELQAAYAESSRQLAGYLRQLRLNEAQTPMSRQVFSTENKGKVGFHLSILNGMSMAAFDPFVAAELSLYHIDKTPPAGYNIYRVSGHWKLPWPFDKVKFNSMSVKRQHKHWIETDAFRLYCNPSEIANREVDKNNYNLILSSKGDTIVQINFLQPVHEVKLKIKNIASLRYKVAINGMWTRPSFIERIEVIEGMLQVTGNGLTSFKHIQVLLESETEWEMEEVHYRTNLGYLGRISSNPFPLHTATPSPAVFPPLLTHVKKESIPAYLNESGQVSLRSHASMYVKNPSADPSSGFVPSLFLYEAAFRPVRLQFGRNSGTMAAAPSIFPLSKEKTTNAALPVLYEQPVLKKNPLVIYLSLKENPPEEVFGIPVRPTGRLVLTREDGEKEKSIAFNGNNAIALSNHAQLKTFMNGFTIRLSIKIHKENTDYRTVVGNTIQAYSFGVVKVSEGMYKLRLYINGRSFDSSYNIPANRWMDIAVSYNLRTVRFFVNGILDYNAEHSYSGAIRFASGNVCIGAEGNPGTGTVANGFHGKIVDLKIWNSSDSLHELQSLFLQFIQSNAKYPLRSLLIHHEGEHAFNSVADVITFPQDPGSLKISDQFSLFLEVNPAAGLSFPTMIGNNFSMSFWFGLNAGDYRLRCWLNGKVYMSAGRITPAVWTKVGVSYDGKHLRFFIADREDTAIPVTGIVRSATTPLKFGADVYNGYLFRGSMRKILIYDIAIVPSQLQVFNDHGSTSIESFQQFTDREVEDGDYQYFVQGIDLFGRVSPWSNGKSIKLKNISEYNAPVNCKARFVPYVGTVTEVIPGEDEKILRYRVTSDLPAAMYGAVQRYEAEFRKPNGQKQSFEINAIREEGTSSARMEITKPLFALFLPEAGDRFLLRFDHKVVLSWVWTGLQQVYNPDIASFSGYMVKGALNEVSGYVAVTHQDPLNPPLFQVQLRLDSAVPENSLNGEMISVQNRLYKILSHGGGNDLSMQIRYLGSPVITPPENAWVKITVPETATTYKDFSLPTHWGRSIVTEAIASISPIISSLPETPSVQWLNIVEWEAMNGRGIDWISRAQVENHRICKIQFSQFPAPAGLPSIEPSDYIPSALTLYTTNRESGGGQWECYYLLWHEWQRGHLTGYFIIKGKDEEVLSIPLIVKNSSFPARLFVGKFFQREIALPEGTDFSADRSTLQYHFAMAASDNLGRQGAFSQKATVLAVDRRHPVPPPQPEVQIGKPDYYNLSSAVISWEPREGVTYQVYRATDASLFTRDLEQRRKGVGFYASETYGRLREDDSDFAEWFECYKHKDPAKAAPGLGVRLRSLTLADLFSSEINPAWTNVTPIWNRWKQRFYERWSGNVTVEEDFHMRRHRSGPYKNMEPVQVFGDDSSFSSWFAENNEGRSIHDLFPEETNSLWTDLIPLWRAWADRFYSVLSDEEVKALAEREGNETAFTLVNQEPVQGAQFTEKIQGSISNRYFYRLRSQGSNQQRSTLWSPVSNAASTSLKSHPPRQPVFTKVEAGDRQVTLQWSLNREADFKEYILYRAERAEDLGDLRWWSTEEDLRIVERIPDPRVVVRNGRISLPFEILSENIFGVYPIEEFNHKAIPLTSQPQALNYYRQPSASQRMALLEVSRELRKLAEGTEVLILYRNEFGAIVKLDASGGKYPYADRGLDGLKIYYYKIVANNALNIRSKPSAVQTAKTLEIAPPETPVVLSQQRIPAAESDTLQLQIRNEEGLQLMIQSRKKGELTWRVAHDWHLPEYPLVWTTQAERSLPVEFKLWSRTSNKLTCENPSYVYLN